MPGHVEALTRRLLPHAQAGHAAGAQAYLKTTRPLLGVRMPQLRSTTRAYAVEQGLVGAEARLEAATELWAQATHREHWYAAGELAAARVCRGRLAFLPLYERMVLEGAWWDVVDGCARRYGELLLAHRPVLEPLLRAWATDDFLWKRRIAMISQLHLGAQTDTALLDYVLACNLDDPEFFIRKALGWSLRQYGKSNPEWVRTWVAAHRDRMSKLSLREAMKHLGPVPD